MSSVKIITDSHSGISKEMAQKYDIDVLASMFSVNGKDYYEGIDLSREEFFALLLQNTNVSTSQPSPSEVTAIWDKALREYDNVLYMPISSGLSSSYATAAMLAADEKYAGRVFVVDHGRVAAPLLRFILDAREMIEEGLSAAEIKRILEANRERMSIYLALDTLEYLKRGGRISAASAVLGTALDIKPVLSLKTGVLSLTKKCRGFKKAKKALFELLRNDFETKFKESFDKNEVHLLAAAAVTEGEAREWIAEVKENFPGTDVLYTPLSLGICCHTGRGALGIACSLKPRR